MGEITSSPESLINMSPSTMVELGLSFASGRDGRTDLVKAHTLLNLAAYQGLHTANALREEIAIDMTREEIIRALREARRILRVH